MNRTPKYVALAAAFAGLASFAQAEERVAILMANSDYTTLRDARDAAAILSLQSDLERAGFEVVAISDLSSDNLPEADRLFRQAIVQGDRVLIAVAGHVVSNNRDAYILTTDAEMPGDLSVGHDAVSLGRLMDLMGDDAGQTVLLVGDSSASLRLSEMPTEGFSSDVSAQGVTFFSGDVADLVDMARSGLLEPGKSYAEVAEAAGRRVEGGGFLSKHMGFLPATEAEAPAKLGGLSSDAQLEKFYFDKARDTGTERAYQDFLKRYPDGTYRREAEKALAALSQSPKERAEAEEAALQLSRKVRREVQSNLTLLGYDTRGVDGIFGSGSRTAISAWQRDAGQAATGYLTAGQVRRIGEDASVERARIERQDRQFWRDTGQTGREDGLRAYLKRFPEGLFAKDAKAQLGRMEAAKKAAREAAAWNEAQQINTEAAYQAFLAEFPNGDYQTDAEARLKAIQEAAVAQYVERDRAEEQQALENPVSKLLAERRLQQLGFNPGAVDGLFDERTRSAIKAFQQRIGVPATGYIGRATVTRLLAG